MLDASDKDLLSIYDLGIPLHSAQKRRVKELLRDDPSYKDRKRRRKALLAQALQQTASLDARQSLSSASLSSSRPPATSDAAAGTNNHSLTAKATMALGTPTTSIERMWKEVGATYTKGPWTPQEDEVLLTGLTNYLVRYKLREKDLQTYVTLSKAQLENVFSVEQIKTLRGCWAYVGTGLQHRSLKQISDHAHILISSSDRPRSSRLSKDELECLDRAVHAAVENNVPVDYTTLGKDVGRNRHSLSRTVQRKLKKEAAQKHQSSVAEI